MRRILVTLPVILFISLLFSKSMLSASLAPVEANPVVISKQSNSFADDAKGIYGNVTANGAALSGVPIELRLFNGNNWFVIESTMTDNTGAYYFRDAETLAPGNKYYVSYGPNESNEDLVYFWYGPTIDNFTAGEDIPGGDFDLANVPLVKPSPRTSASLPVIFEWTRRGIEGDTYRLVIIDPDNDVFWTTTDLGDTDSYELNELPPDILPNRHYAWYVEVYMGPDNFGESFEIYDITFETEVTPTITPTPPSTPLYGNYLPIVFGQ